MQVKRIAEWEHSAILLTFIKLPFVIKIFVLSFLSGLRHVLLYWLPTCTFCFVEFVNSLWVFLLKWDFFTTKTDGSTGPTAFESDGPYFEIMGQWLGPTINLKTWIDPPWNAITHILIWPKTYLRCALRCEVFPYTLLQPGIWQICSFLLFSPVLEL